MRICRIHLFGRLSIRTPFSSSVQLLRTGVGVEKVPFLPKQPNFGGYKMSRKLEKSFVGHPSAILFLRISGEGVFQQATGVYAQNHLDEVGE